MNALCGTFTWPNSFMRALPRFCFSSTFILPGCLLSSSIACGLASGLPMLESIRRAKERLSDALARGLSLGHGNSPVDFR